MPDPRSETFFVVVRFLPFPTFVPDLYLCPEVKDIFGRGTVEVEAERWQEQIAENGAVSINRHNSCLGVNLKMDKTYTGTVQHSP